MKDLMRSLVCISLCAILLIGGLPCVVKAANYTDTWVIVQTVWNPDGYPRPMFGVYRKADLDPSTWISRTTSASITQNLENETISKSPFPGPEIRLKRGDWVNLTVLNWLDDVTTSIHWHGILMQNNAWMDGSFAVTQCGIESVGGSFRYYFQVDQEPGTFWWHSHSPQQYGDGIFGAFIIEEDEPNPKYSDDPVLFINDWHHETYHTVTAKYISRIEEYPGFIPDYPWPSQNVLLNGRGQFPCTWILEEDCVNIRNWGWPWFETNGSKLAERAPGEGTNAQCQPQRPPFIGACTANDKYAPEILYESIESRNETAFEEVRYQLRNFTSEFLCVPGETVLLRLVNSGTSIPLRFWIDRHNVTIVAKDGVKIVPDGPHIAVLLNLGQRLDLEINCDQDPTYIYQFFAAMAHEYYPGSIARQPRRFSYGLMEYEGTSTLVLAKPQYPPSVWPANNLTASWGNSSTTYLPMHEFELTPLDESERTIPPATQRIILHTRGYGNWPEYYPGINHKGQSVEWWLVNGKWFSYPEEPVLQAEKYGQTIPANTLPYIGVIEYDPDEPKWVEVVLVNYEGQEHPWHLHGYKKHVVGYGWFSKKFQWRTRGYPSNPETFVNNSFVYNNSYHGLPDMDEVATARVVADTITPPPHGFVVFRFKADNPGPWLFHCHMEYHVAAGLGLVLSVQDKDGQYPLMDPPADFPLCGQLATVSRVGLISPANQSTDLDCAAQNPTSRTRDPYFWSTVALSFALAITLAVLGSIALKTKKRPAYDEVQHMSQRRTSSSALNVISFT
eukprot:TRINITY_DN28873_c0_g1_i1.p1 TRINITY_DN28873_c0_g1~~TRINITY_DN28873_c0_g1_i1.p1  ORF type:complete len:795 (-),score=140.61 TRINITY_DN28873_c0_g1_i1:118-2478(-)